MRAGVPRLTSRHVWLYSPAFFIILLAFYLAAWPLVWRLVILPHASQERLGLEVITNSRLDGRGRDVASQRVENSFFRLEQPQASQVAYAVWDLAQVGDYELRLECDDYGSVALDHGKPILELEGQNAHNPGQVTLRLQAGPHLLKLRLHNAAVILGLALLTWAMYPTRYRNGLNFASFLDVALRWRPRLELPRRELGCSALALAIWLARFAALHLILGWGLFFRPHDQPGLDFLRFNLFKDPDSWRQLYVTLGALPFLALAGFRRSPLALKRFFLLIAPIWFAVHTVIAFWAETRVFIPPMAMIFIPMSLFAALGPLPARPEA